MAATATQERPASAPMRRHPPGPRSRVATAARWLTRPVELLESCRSRYGETFTLDFPGAGKNVMISDPATVKEVFSRDRRGNGVPQTRDLLLEPVLGPRSILLLEGDEHLRRRKLMLPPFHGERMRAYRETIESVTEREVARWPIGERFPLHPAMQTITLEVILEAVFGVTDRDRRESLRRRLLSILALGQSARTQVLGLAFRRFSNRGPYRIVEERLARADEILLAEIAERRADPALAEREDILSMLVEARFEDGEGMDDVEIRDQLMTLLLAGHETTATALAWTFDLLFHRPDATERLVAELEAGETEYLDAVCQESLRVRPVVPAVGRRLAEPLRVGDYELQAGDFATPCIYLVHTREDLYPEPYAFRPERFLDTSPETYSWIPFGGGTRRCLGAAFATFEMQTALRKILTHARLEPGTDRPEPTRRRNVTFSPANGTPAVLAQRSASN
jgi:cytochrome P450 family 135